MKTKSYRALRNARLNAVSEAIQGLHFRWNHYASCSFGTCPDGGMRLRTRQIEDGNWLAEPILTLKNHAGQYITPRETFARREEAQAWCEQQYRLLIYRMLGIRCEE